MENKKNGIRAVGNSIQSLILLLFRLFWGYQFAISGFGKFLHYSKVMTAFESWGILYPKFAVGFVGAVELIGGLFLIFGLFTRLSCIPLFLLMIGAYLTADKAALMGLFERFDLATFMSATPFLFLISSFVIFCFGPGKIALDYIVGGFNKTKEMP